MANYAVLKAAIEDVIKQNGNNEITGNLLQQALISIINVLGSGYNYIGMANPSTNPGTPDYNVFYICKEPGIYTGFGNIEVSGLSILKYMGSWSKDELFGTEYLPTRKSQKLVQGGGVFQLTGGYGLNIFDEQFELGDIGGSGQPIPGSTTLRTVNFTPCIPDWDYMTTENRAYIYYYDAAQSFISLASLEDNDSFHTPANAAFFKLVLFTSYGTTYNNDVKIFQKLNWIPDIEKLKSSLSANLEYGVNDLFDGNVEIGDIETGRGKNYPETRVLRTVNYVPIFPNTQYLIKLQTPDGPIAYYYDENFLFLSYATIYNNQPFNSPANAKYMRIVFPSSYGTTYHNDLFIYQYQGVGKDILELMDKIKIFVPVDNWEIGDIGSSGQTIPGSTTLRTVDYIAIPKFESLSLTCKSLGGGSIVVGYAYYYDINKNYISNQSVVRQLSIPENAFYVKFVLSSAYGTTYNNDVDLYDEKGLNGVLYDFMASYNDFVYSKFAHTFGATWEIGDIGGNGQPVSGSTTLRTVDFINCSKAKSINVIAPLQQIGYIYYYDSVKAFIQLNALYSGKTSLPDGAKYFKVVLSSAYGTVYNNDVIMSALYESNVVDYIVSKDGDGDFTTLTDAVAAAVDGDIIFVKNGEYDNETVRAWGKNVTIIGQDKYKTIIKGPGDYLNPPFEMSSGVLKNITAYAYGETPSPNGRYAYAIHADNGILANNSFIVENCILRTKKGQGAVGMGLRGNCYVLFKDCDFICENEAAFFMNETVTAPNWNQAPGDQHFEFNNCKFISESATSPTARFEGYHSRGGFVYATFINNVFVQHDKTPMAYFYQPGETYWDPECENIEGNVVINSQGDRLINWFITENSFGNTIPAMNKKVDGTINGL